LAALVEHLMMRDYSSHAIGRIFDHVACNGCLEGSLVEPDDMADAEACFVDALRPVDYSSPAWGEPDEATLISHEAPDGASVVRRMQAKGVLPVSGGAPEPYQPTPEDLADLADWLERLDRERDIAEQREFWRRHSIAAFNAERTD
jgi:hypothetical protein